jgi:hypothetical protein
MEERFRGPAGVNEGEGERGAMVEEVVRLKGGGEGSTERALRFLLE